MIVTPDSVAQHIAAGKYLGRDIEFAAMAAGSAEMSREDNVVTLTKQAGWIGAGTPTLTIPAYNGSNSITPGASAQTLSLAGLANITINGDANLKAANIKSGVSIFGITGSYSGQSYSTYSGATTITPSSSNQYFYTNGYVVNSNLKVNGDSDLKAANIKNGVSIFGVTGRYEGDTGSLLFQIEDVYPSSAGTGSIYCDGYPYMFGFIANTTTSGKIAAGMGRRGSSTGRAYVAGYGAGNALSISWKSSYFTVDIASGFYNYSFDTGVSYTFWIGYM